MIFDQHFHDQIFSILVYKCQSINQACLVLPPFIASCLSPENLAIRNLVLNGLSALPGAIFKLFRLYFDKTSHEVNNKLEHKYLSSSKIKIRASLFLSSSCCWECAEQRRIKSLGEYVRVFVLVQTGKTKRKVTDQKEGAATLKLSSFVSGILNALKRLSPSCPGHFSHKEERSPEMALLGYQPDYTWN